MTRADSWRQFSYGKLTGADIESCIIVFREIWKDRAAWAAITNDESEWVRAVERMMGVPSWTSFYQDSLLQLLGKVVVVAGISEAVIAAAGSMNPAEAMLQAMKLIPEDPPDHPAAVPLAFAMIGNLDAIARYSRSINDMIEACKQGDVESLFTALTVDSSLSTMPFFQAALRLGQLSGDGEAAQQIFKAIRGPHGKRLEYPELRWAEYLLRDQGVNRPGFPRHLAAIIHGSNRGVYEQQAIHGRVQGRGGQAGH